MDVKSLEEFTPNKIFYLAIASLSTLALVAALGSTSLSIALPVCHNSSSVSANVSRVTTEAKIDHRQPTPAVYDAGILARSVKYSGCYCNSAQLCMSRGLCWQESGVGGQCHMSCRWITRCSTSSGFRRPHCRTDLARDWHGRGDCIERDHCDGYCSFAFPWPVPCLCQYLLGDWNCGGTCCRRRVGEWLFLGLFHQKLVCDHPRLH
jgi:hypothetical protein